MTIEGVSAHPAGKLASRDRAIWSSHRQVPPYLRSAGGVLQLPVSANGQLHTNRCRRTCSAPLPCHSSVSPVCLLSVFTVYLSSKPCFSPVSPVLLPVYCVPVPPASFYPATLCCRRYTFNYHSANCTICTKTVVGENERASAASITAWHHFGNA